MPKSLTFIHAADLHLGAPFRGLQALSESWADRLISAISESYTRVIDAAISNQVDFVVIAGDIFDSTRTSYADYLTFFKGLERLNEQGIPAYLCTGNHDPYTSWQQDFLAFPSNTTMFPADKPGFAVFEKEGEPYAVLGGRGYYNQVWPIDEDISGGIDRVAAQAAAAALVPGASSTEVPFALGIIHTGLNLDPEKAPTDPNKLMAKNMDYWALGHIHLKYAYPADDPHVVFSGCIQGRDIKETGERGVYKVTLTEGEQNKLEFIPTASVVWQRTKVDVTDCGSLGDVTDTIMRALFRENGKAHCEEMCVRITLTGKTELHTVLEKPGVLQDLRKSINDSYPVFFCDTLLDKTVMPLDKATLSKEGLFPAVFLQAAQSANDNQAEGIAYLQDEFFQKNLSLPRSCEKNFAVLSEEAENLVLDLLGGSDA